jgi:hypothetical protein
MDIKNTIQVLNHACPDGMVLWPVVTPGLSGHVQVITQTAFLIFIESSNPLPIIPFQCLLVWEWTGWSRESPTWGELMGKPKNMMWNLFLVGDMYVHPFLTREWVLRVVLVLVIFLLCCWEGNESKWLLVELTVANHMQLAMTWHFKSWATLPCMRRGCVELR